MSLGDAISAHLASEGTEPLPLVSYVLYAVRMDPADETLATDVIVPDGQPFYTTIGLLRSATMEVEDTSISYAWLEVDDDDSDSDI